MRRRRKEFRVKFGKRYKIEENNLIFSIQHKAKLKQ
jgi:hypothetical protein